MADELICDIFIRSYWKDLEWLQLCLASIERYCQGFRDVIVVAPRSSEPWLRRTRLPHSPRIQFCRDYADDYLGQQVTKLFADILTDADYICHVDSDCIFCRPTSPRDLIVEGKPIVMMQSCALLDRHLPWQGPTEKFMGCRVLDDFMRQPPFTFPRWLYPKLREHVLRTHGMNAETYVMAQPPRGFSEYNALGAFAWEYYHEHFSWLDISALPAPEARCRWYWSWGGLDSATRREIEAIVV